MNIKWPKENNQDKRIKVILFLISPFIAVIYSLKTIKKKSSYIVFFLFAVFFGMAFTVPLGRTSDFLGDGAIYREWFNIYRNTSQADFINGWERFITFDNGKKDYYFDTVAFYISQITDNYHVMFMVFAIVFAYFSLKSLKIFTSEISFNNSLTSIILLYLFMYNQIYGINGVRFWTAAWIGVYSIFQIFKNGKNSYWLLVLLIPYFHGSFWIFIVILLLAYFLQRFEKTWSVLFIISFFLSTVAVEFIRASQDFLPVFLSKMVGFYTNEDYIETRSSGGTGFFWVQEFFRIGMNIIINIMVFLFIKNSNIIKKNPKSKMLYHFLVVWMTFTNLVMFVPSLGNRYVVLAYPIIAYIWLVNFKDKKYNKILYLLAFIFTWHAYNRVINYTNVLEWDFYFSNPFYLIYKYLIV